MIPGAESLLERGLRGRAGEAAPHSLLPARRSRRLLEGRRERCHLDRLHRDGSCRRACWWMLPPAGGPGSVALIRPVVVFEPSASSLWYFAVGGDHAVAALAHFAGARRRGWASGSAATLAGADVHQRDVCPVSPGARPPAQELRSTSANIRFDFMVFLSRPSLLAGIDPALRRDRRAAVERMAMWLTRSPPTPQPMWFWDPSIRRPSALTSPGAALQEADLDQPVIAELPVDLRQRGVGEPGLAEVDEGTRSCARPRRRFLLGGGQAFIAASPRCG